MKPGEIKVTVENDTHYCSNILTNPNRLRLLAVVIELWEAVQRKMKKDK